MENGISLYPGLDNTLEENLQRLSPGIYLPTYSRNEYGGTKAGTGRNFGCGTQVRYGDYFRYLAADAFDAGYAGI